MHAEPLLHLEGLQASVSASACGSTRSQSFNKQFQSHRCSPFCSGRRPIMKTISGHFLGLCWLEGNIHFRPRNGGADVVQSKSPKKAPFPRTARQGPQCPCCAEETLLAQQRPDVFECLGCGLTTAPPRDDMQFQGGREVVSPKRPALS